MNQLQSGQLLQVRRGISAGRNPEATEKHRAGSYRTILGRTAHEYGKLLVGDSRPDASLRWYELAIQTLRPVVEKDPLAWEPRGYLKASHWGRAIALEQLHRHEEAVREWDRAVALAPASQQPQLRTYRAVELLRKSVGAGWKNPGHVERDTDLSALLARGDFQTLLTESWQQFPPEKGVAPQPREK